ncbi:2-dehydro-3-deoxygalactonokinase [Paracoccus pacificus]|uniref:2-dehydro-3-deoxygalactonokinase n=1 Tax=Paracoccus pacificus TaxID=1463598 RepID=A0ABW4R716_9RHOB
MVDAPRPEWLAVDWGTSRLRVWAMAGDHVLEARASDQGMGGLGRDGFEPALLALTEGWLPATGQIPVIACGMVGARTGWAEADYRAIPCTPLDPAAAARPAVRDPRLSVLILPGLSQAEPPDVMRGEETQIAGFLARHPDHDGTLCLPGTHSKWVRLAGGKVTSFRTFMTGELYALLSRQSVLRLSIGEAEPDAAAFATAAAHPGAMVEHLFPLRAASLLNGATPEVTAGRLSGLLIGAEVAAARDFWHDRRVTLIGAPGISALYAQALATHRAAATQMDGAELVLDGLRAARRALSTDATGKDAMR